MLSLLSWVGPATLDPYMAFVKGHRDRPGPPATLFLESPGQRGPKLTLPKTPQILSTFQLAEGSTSFPWAHPVPFLGMGDIIQVHLAPGGRGQAGTQESPKISERPLSFPKLNSLYML